MEGPKSIIYYLSLIPISNAKSYLKHILHVNCQKTMTIHGDAEVLFVVTEMLEKVKPKWLNRKMDSEE